MPDDILHLRQLLLRGHCCSSAILAAALKHKGSDNQELLAAMNGLCNGLNHGLLCGALSGAACMMTMLMPQATANGALTELAEWFEAVFGQEYGGMNCRDILGDTPIMRIATCPRIIEETYVQAKQILEEHGYMFAEDVQ